MRAASEQAARFWFFSSDENSIEREGKIVFAFVLNNKRGIGNIFIKPNRLEIFPKSEPIDPNYSALKFES